jgi:CRP-like cAMP-binding protein
MSAGGEAKSKSRTNATAARKRTGKMFLPEAFDVEAFLTTSGTVRTVETYKPKSHIFGQGTKSAAVFYIQNGRVELSVVSGQGKERIVGIGGSARDAENAKTGIASSRYRLFASKTAPSN